MSTDSTASRDQLIADFKDCIETAATRKYRTQSRIGLAKRIAHGRCTTSQCSRLLPRTLHPLFPLYLPCRATWVTARQDRLPSHSTGATHLPWLTSRPIVSAIACLPNGPCRRPAHTRGDQTTHRPESTLLELRLPTRRWPARWAE